MANRHNNYSQRLIRSGLLHCCLFTVCAIFAQANEAAESRNPGEQADKQTISVSAALVERQSSLRQRIAAIESEAGPYSEALMEPLSELTNTYVELENYPEANRLLDQRLQLLRVVNGPTSVTQLPAVKELITYGIRQQNWRSVTEQFQFIAWLYTNNPETGAVEKLQALHELSSWHLAAVYLDELANRYFHRREHIKIVEWMLLLAEAEFGEHSEALVPWLYRSALAIYQYGAGERTAAIREPKAISTRIRRIIEESGNLEAEAMAMVYEADFVKLSGRMAPVNRMYLKARDKFGDAGIEEARIDAFFNQATMIPMAVFHFSIDSALAEQAPTIPESNFRTNAGIEITEFVEFLAWEEPLPRFVRPRRPERPSYISEAKTPIYSSLLQLEVNGRGLVNQVQVIASVPDDHRVRNHAEDGVSRIVFRPNPVNWWRSESRTVTVMYSYPPINRGPGLAN